MKRKEQQQPRAHGHTQTKAPAEAEEFIPTSDLPERIEDTQSREEALKRLGVPPEPALESPVQETPHKPATPRSLRKTRRREKMKGRRAR